MRILFPALLLALSIGSFGQSLNQKRIQPATATTQETTPAQRPVMSAASQHYYQKYATASRWNDLDVARDALYDLIIENPGNDSLMFTLGYIYYQNQKYASSLLIAQDLLVRKPKEEAYLELAAVSAQELGVIDRALQHFENLFLVNKDINTQYQIAFLQFNLKKYPECVATADNIIARPESSTMKVVFNDAQGKQKEYPMKVAVINLKGLVALEKGDKAGAKKLFNDALAAAPDFVPAKENLEKTK